ncbi:MAG TPA: UDP-3-O-(3-hydroxymyristoyl)glucosamine N-acyltransferase [Phycisphaerae bacterium]|nr:UDP-3-O-(3-hydroxymyristoyl)glucosamine N-acyltransferase [Phycisphaerae bacterium]
MSTGYTLAEIAGWVGGTLRGDAEVRITGVAGIDEADASQITWLVDETYAARLRTSKAGAALAPNGFGQTPMPAILCDKPSLGIIEVLRRFAPAVPRPATGVHPSACVDPTARLGKDVTVGPQCVVGRGARIGDRGVLHAHVFVGSDTIIGADCELWPCVVVRERCTLGDRVIIHPNTTIGSDGFGYEFDGRQHVKIPQIGTVEIEADVEIGANCTVDRAKFGVTRVGAGTKIDNQVQVAHNVQIGGGCIIVAQSGIAGSTRLGRGVVLGGKVGVKDHVVLGDGVQAAACACISKDIPPGSRVIGSPAVDYDQFVRERAKIRRLPQLADEVKNISERVRRLEASADH